MSLIATDIYCEATGDTIRLTLTEEQHQRAAIDQEYLQQLVNKAVASQSQESSESGPRNADEAFLEQDGNNDENSSFIWTNSAVLLLLSLYEEHAQEFNVKRHKKVWEEIAKLMKETNPSLNVTGPQCQTKLNGLKRTYKKILDHNNISGNDRALWPFFERMHKIFSSTKWAQPLAVASERGPFPSVSLQNTENQENIRPPNKKKTDRFLERYFQEIKTHHQMKREERQERFEKIMEMKEKHHREKLILLKEFLDKKSE